MLNNKSRGYFTLGDGNTTFFLAVIMMLVLSNVLSPIITVLPRIISNQAVLDVLTVALNSLIQIGMLLVFFNFSRIRGRKPAIYFNKVGVLSRIGGG